MKNVALENSMCCTPQSTTTTVSELAASCSAVRQGLREKIAASPLTQFVVVTASENAAALT